MFNFILLILGVFLAVYTGTSIYQDPGYVLLSYKNYSLEAPLWLAASSLMLFFILFYCVISTIYALVRVKNRISMKFKENRRLNSYARTKKGLESFFLGEWAIAEKNLLKGINYGQINLLNYMFAARCAQALGSISRRDKYLNLAKVNLKANKELIELVEAQLNLEHGNLDDSLSILTALNKKTQHPKSVLNILKTVYLQLEDYKSLALMLNDLKINNVLKKEEFFSLAKETYTKLMEEIYSSADINALDSLWSKIPKEIIKDPQIIYSYARLQLISGNTDNAANIIESFFKRNWDSNLIVLYAYIQTDNLASQISNTEKWLRARPEDSDLLFAAGKLCYANKMYSQSKAYLEKSLALKESIQVYNELGCLMKDLDDLPMSIEYFTRASSMLKPSHV